MTTSALTLRAIRTRGAVVPLPRPLPTKVVTLTTAPLVLNDLETAEGVTGRAYAFAYLERAIPLLRRLLDDIGSLFAGQQLAPATQFDTLLKRTTLLGHEGLAMMAISGFDMAEVSAHLLAATPTAHWLEYVDWANPILARPLAIRDGEAELGDSPGIGLEWNEAAVARFSFDA